MMGKGMRNVWELAASRCMVPTMSAVVIAVVFSMVNGNCAVAEEDRPKQPQRIDYNRHIRPILARACFACHGVDENNREAGLRLDVRSAATEKLESGTTAIVPGHPGKSELIRRVTSDDEFTRMPPADSKKTLTPAESALLKQWIHEGAAYERHWAFVTPRRPAVPAVSNSERLRNPIDHFIVSRLQAAAPPDSGEFGPKAIWSGDRNLRPPADRYTLIRRVSLDLRGIPPSPEEVRAFINDRRPDAYERLVDGFLHDPRYGERWARVWLDLARYADSRGYGSDPLRPNIWRYRDWVIDAFNRNLPYDRFTLEQLAGDLLPNPTLEQKIATAFHRNTMTNTEGGTDDEEFRVAAVRDRVDTTLQVWMGLTMGCAKCHNHKYDPITQKEYYRFYAFFNQTADSDKPSETPVIEAPRRQDLEAVERIERRIAELQQRLTPSIPELRAAQQRWEQRLRHAAGKRIRARYVRIELPGQGKLLSLAEVQVKSKGKNVARGNAARQSSTAYQGPAKLAVDGNTNGDYFRAQSTTHTKWENNPWWEVDLGDMVPVDEVVLWNRTDNNLHKRLNNFRIVLLDEKRTPVWKRNVPSPPNPNSAFQPGGIRSTVPKEILDIVDTPAEKRTAKDNRMLAEHYRSVAPSLKKIRETVARLKKSKPKFPTVPVMQELPKEKRRSTYVMVKGNFLERGEPVEPGVPDAFHHFPTDVPHNRLGVAQWLMHEDNPLTARVAVNRFWARIFGTGLVETEEDFGTQGELPSHPKLLDWLAVEFRESGWDIKRLLKLIVTSSTYRQSSSLKARHTPSTSQAHATSSTVLQNIDPRNRLLWRFPRVRLEAEMVRDQALVLSGLLSHKMKGPSVYPPQPKGLWRAAFNGQRTWPTSTGQDRYRRGLYTFWRRTVPYPSMAVFDAPSREICTVRRIRTNTPLQAFVTLNDPVYVECAQALARRIVREGGEHTEERIRFALFLCTSRPPTAEQVQTLRRLYDTERAHYQQNKDAAEETAVGPLGPLPDGMNMADLAAWTVVSNVLLNMDAVLTRK